MWFLRRMQRISYTEHVTNVEVLRRANTKRKLLSEMLNRQVKLFGHVMRKEEMENLVTTGYVEDCRLCRRQERVPTTPACTWWNRPEEDPSSGKLESTHPSRTSVKYDQVFFGVESIMRVNAASLDIRDATTSTPGTLNDLTTDLIMANNNNNNKARELGAARGKPT